MWRAVGVLYSVHRGRSAAPLRPRRAVPNIMPAIFGDSGSISAIHEAVCSFGECLHRPPIWRRARWRANLPAQPQAPRSGLEPGPMCWSAVPAERSRFSRSVSKAAPVSTSRPASERSACVTSREPVVTDLGLSSKLTSEVPLLCPGNDPDGEAASGAPQIGRRKATPAPSQQNEMEADLVIRLAWRIDPRP